MQDPKSPNPHASAEAAAIAAVEAFQRAFRAQDLPAWAAALNYPHLRLANGRLETYETPEAFLAAQQGKPARLQKEGWHMTVTRDLRVVHSSADKVHLAICNERVRADGTPYERFETLWIATRVEGHWGIQFRSSFLRR